MEKIGKVEIIYQDNDLAVVYKPAGMVTTAEGRKVEGSLQSWAKKDLGTTGVARGGIVHRLDKATAGLVLVAKDNEILWDLRQQFKNRSVKKRYWALAEGNLPFEGAVKVPVGRSKYRFGRFAAGVGGRMAETAFRLLDKYRRQGKVYSLIEVSPKTGRTHQIRVHLAYLGWPISGDRIYGSKVGEPRLFLQAFSLTFRHPRKGELMTVDCGLDRGLELLLETYEKI